MRSLEEVRADIGLYIPLCWKVKNALWAVAPNTTARTTLLEANKDLGRILTRLGEEEQAVRDFMNPPLRHDPTRGASA